jgi:hypothetical protein
VSSLTELLQLLHCLNKSPQEIIRFAVMHGNYELFIGEKLKLGSDYYGWCFNGDYPRPIDKFLLVSLKQNYGAIIRSLLEDYSYYDDSLCYDFQFDFEWDHRWYDGGMSIEAVIGELANNNVSQIQQLTSFCVRSKAIEILMLFSSLSSDIDNIKWAEQQLSHRVVTDPT